jgi:hypothetical protein
LAELVKGLLRDRHWVPSLLGRRFGLWLLAFRP